MLCPIVGMAFRPPAARVLNNLSSGQALRLQRQPDNPHDSNAIQVFLDGFGEDKLEALHAELSAESIPDDAELSRGQWHQSALQDPMFLGYIAAKTGEAETVARAMDEGGDTFCFGKLTFTLEGKPAVELNMAAFEEEEELEEE